MDRLDFSLQTHNFRAIVVAAHTNVDDMSNIIIVKAPTAWLMSVDFLYLIRELIIATRQESLMIDSVCDEVSFPWVAVAGMSFWQFDMPCFSHLRQTGLLSSPTQVGQSDRGLLWFYLSGSLHKHINSDSCSPCLNFKYRPHYYVFKLSWCECIQTQVYTIARVWVLLKILARSSWLRQLSKEETR